jgi:hypothetical protein
MDTPSILGSDEYFKLLDQELKKCKSRRQLENAIVNAPFIDRRTTTMLGLGIVVLLLVNKSAGTIDRIALANTDLARGTVEMSAKPFKEIKIPANDRLNFIARAIKERHYMITSDWQYLFIPALSPEEARFNQAGGGIACSVVYPLNNVLDGGALIFSYYETIERIGILHHNFMTRYASLVGKALQRSSGS